MANKTSTLVIDIVAKDNASKTLKGVSDDVGSAGKALKGALALISTAAIVAGIKDVVDAASDLNETVAKTEQIFGPSAQAIKDFAKNSATEFGLSQQAALDAASTFAVFGKAAGLSGAGLEDFSTSMVGLSADLASFGNTSPEEAINAIGSALRGEAEPIRKYGVLLDDATLRNRAMALGLIKTTKEALTPQQKALAAQAEILAQTKDAQGDFARTSDGLANQQRILAAQFENTKAELGNALLPVMQAVASFMTTTLLPAFTGFIDFVKEHGSVFGPIAIGLGVLVGVIWALNIALAANPVVLVVGAIIIGLTALVASILWAYNNWGWFKTAIDAFVEGAKIVWAWLAQNVPKVGAWFADLWAKVGPILGNIGSAIRTVFGFIVEQAQNVWQAIQRMWTAIEPGLTQFALAVNDLWNSVISPALTAIGTAFQWLWSTVLSPILGFIGQALQGLWAIAQAVFPYIVSAVQMVAGVFQFLWNIAGPILGFLFSLIATGIETSVTAFKVLGAIISWLWSNIIQPLVNLAIGVFQQWWAVVQAVTGFIVGALQTLAGFVQSIVGRIVAVGRGIWDWLWNGLEGIINFISDKINGLVSTVTGLRDSIARAASGMWDGIWQAFRGAINFIVDGWNNLSFSLPGFTIPGTDIGWSGITLDTPNIPRLAAGGIVSRPTLAMIGEAGPEAIVPLGKGLGTTINVYVTSTGLGPDSPQVARDVVAAIRSYVTLNGPVSGIVPDPL